MKPRPVYLVYLILVIAVSVALYSLRFTRLSVAHAPAKISSDNPSPSAATPAPPDPASLNLQWGEPSGNLQMALLVQNGAGYIHCWVRNSTDQEIRYHSSDIGYWESIGIEIQTDKGWTHLQGVFLGSGGPARLVYGIWPMNDVKTLAPKQIIAGTSPRALAAGRYAQPVNHANTFEFPFREELPKPSSLGATFIVDVGDYHWPGDVLDQKRISVRITQEWRGPVSSDHGPEQYKPLYINSPEFDLSGPDLKILLDKINQKPGAPKQ